MPSLESLEILYEGGGYRLRLGDRGPGGWGPKVVCDVNADLLHGPNRLSSDDVRWDLVADGHETDGYYPIWVSEEHAGPGGLPWYSDGLRRVAYLPKEDAFLLLFEIEAIVVEASTGRTLAAWNLLDISEVDLSGQEWRSRAEVDDVHVGYDAHTQSLFFHTNQYLCAARVDWIGGKPVLTLAAKTWVAWGEPEGGRLYRAEVSDSTVDVLVCWTGQTRFETGCETRRYLIEDLLKGHYPAERDGPGLRAEKISSSATLESSLRIGADMYLSQDTKEEVKAFLRSWPGLETKSSDDESD